MTAEEILNELEQWVFLNHDHHQGCEGNEERCSGANRPYVDSLALVAKIQELRKGL